MSLFIRYPKDINYSATDPLYFKWGNLLLTRHVDLLTRHVDPLCRQASIRDSKNQVMGKKLE